MTTGTVGDQGSTARPDRFAGSGRAVSGWPGLARVRAWHARHPLLFDGTLTLLILAAVFSVFGVARVRTGHPVLLVAALEAALVLPLLWRRRWPVPVFAVICGVAFVQWLLGAVLFGDVALLFALYSVAAHCPRRLALCAAGLLEVGVLLAVLRWTPGKGVLTSIVFLTGMVVAAFVLGVNIRTRRAYLASLEDRALRAERERDQRAQIAAASERARIAREMHDIVAHNLSVMIALADGAAFAARSNTEAAELAARQVSDTGRQALSEMHRLLDVLRGNGEASPLAPQPGIEQLDDLVAQVRTAGLPTYLTITGRPFGLPPTAQLAVYRLVQEALTNILKHARNPSEARITLNYAEPALIVTITDDGQGAERVIGATSGGHGLTGMRERAAVFGGTVRAGPRPHGGWQVHAIFTAPVPSARMSP